MNASINGKAYERQVAKVCAQVSSPHAPHAPLNTQTPGQLGGCSGGHDVALNFKAPADTFVEVKGRNAPDWIQTSIIPKRRRWTSRPKSQLPKVVTRVIERHLTNVNIFGNTTPIFLERKISHDEWLRLAPQYKDCYFDCPSTTIAMAYKMKGANYIQVMGYGLYHTGKDTCGFGVPKFECQQRVRVRCKRHGRNESEKSIPTSVVASLRPILSTLAKSPFSLDAWSKLPPCLRSRFKATANSYQHDVTNPPSA
jgi:hypothetical protein